MGHRNQGSQRKQLEVGNPKWPQDPRETLFSHHLQVGNLSRTIEKINGVARCPYDPRHNSTAVISSQGELYAATVIDFSGRDPAIYRSLGSGPPLRTAQYNSKWLNGKVARPGEGLSCLPKPIGLSSLSCFVNKVDRAGKVFSQRPRHTVAEPQMSLGPRTNTGQAIRGEG